MFKVPEKYRITENHQLASNSRYGNNGAFLIKYETYEVYCIASDGGGWEHVSVSYSTTKIPSWNMMCFIKNMFWDEEDCVIQFHPPKSEYVNCHPTVLHLWRKVGTNIETPPKIFV